LFVFSLTNKRIVEIYMKEAILKPQKKMLKSIENQNNNRMKTLNQKIRKVAIIIGIIMFLTYCIMLIYGLNEDNNAFINKEYYGVISNIKYIEGNRGVPSIDLNHERIYLGVRAASVGKYIQIGDSIVKKRGHVEIIVYRKKNEKWYGKIFK